MLWYEGTTEYGHTDYEAKQFNGRGECLDYIWDNKASMKMGVDSRPGASIVRQRELTSTKSSILYKNNSTL